MKSFVILFVIALCGTRTSSFNADGANRILGGSQAAEGQFRHMVSLQQRSQLSSITRGHRCGGALVSLRHAVTAATCLVDVETIATPNGFMWSYRQINVNEYRVFAGATALTNDNSNDRHRRITRMTLHPDYRLGTPFINDVAVLTLNSAFSSNVVSIVPIAASDPSPNAAPCTSSGWGAQNHSSTASTQLMHLQKMVVDPATCQSFYTAAGAGGNTQVTLRDTMICASANGIHSSCLGDRGNPLVCNGFLSGILLINSNDCSGAPGNILRPEVYTRTSSYRVWLESASGAYTFQPGMAVVAIIAIAQIIKTNVFY